MSYISREKRAIIDVQPIGNCQLLDDEELTYALLSIAKQYVERSKNKSALYSDVIGAFSNAKDEFWRTMVLPINQQNRHDHE